MDHKKVLRSATSQLVTEMVQTTASSQLLIFAEVSTYHEEETLTILGHVYLACVLLKADVGEFFTDVRQEPGKLLWLKEANKQDFLKHK